MEDKEKRSDTHSAKDNDWFASEKEREYYTKIIQQTSEETAGIPTPPDQEHMAATDKISEFVEKMMDEVQETFFPEEDEDA